MVVFINRACSVKGQNIYVMSRLMSSLGLIFSFLFKSASAVERYVPTCLNQHISEGLAWDIFGRRLNMNALAETVRLTESVLSFVNRHDHLNAEKSDAADRK